VSYLNLLAKHTGVILLVLVATLVMTQSRGPWMGLIVALGIASIGRARSPLRRAILVFSVGILVGIPLYSASKDYLNQQNGDVSEEQGSAQYRQQIWNTYVPIAQLGGAWGWGNRFPVIEGRSSIDNEYLLVWLVQGYVGLAALVLIFAEGTLAFAQSGIVTRSRQERHFIFTLLGIWLGLAVCLATVWLSSTPSVLFFILAGWSQSIRPAREGEGRRLEERAEAMPLQIGAVRVFT
jgi:hypothetical protein